MKKYIISGFLGLVLVFGLAVPSAKAETNDEIIQQLLKMIANLTAQLNYIIAQRNAGIYIETTTTTPVGTNSSNLILTDMSVGSVGEDVVKLQNFLISKGFLTLPAGVAAGRFDQLTKSAVMSYQDSVGVNPTGYVGPITRAKINASLTSTDSSSSLGSISVIYPRGGNILENSGGKDSGKIATIRWSMINTKDYQVNIYLLNEKNEAIRTIARKVSGSSYDWMYDQTLPSGRYQIRVDADYENKGGPSSGYSGLFNLSSNYDSSTVSEKDGISIEEIELKSVSRDEVGIWENFGPGKGNANKNNLDWYWQLVVDSEKTTKIKSIKIEHTPAGEGWSTNAVYMYNRAYAYPLKVIGKAYENTRHDSDINLEVKRGLNYYDLYGQPENTSFLGGKITVEFADGTILTKSIPASSLKAPYGDSVSNPSSASIRVLSPNGGEGYKGGQSVDIKVVTNLSDSQAQNIKLQLHKKTNNFYGISYVRSIAVTGWKGSSDYSWTTWTVPTDLSTGEYYIYAHMEGAGGSDFSDTYFTIINDSTSSAAIPTLPINSPIEKYYVTLSNGNKVAFYESFGGGSIPRLLSLSKTTASKGDTITISGKNLKTDSINIVYIDTLKNGQFTSDATAIGMTSDSQSLNFKIGDWASGQYYVYVMNEDGQSNYMGLYIN